MTLSDLINILAVVQIPILCTGWFVGQRMITHLLPREKERFQNCDAANWIWDRRKSR